MIENLDDYKDRVRIACSAGHRMFNLMPNGAVTRCCGYWYAKKSPMGYITDVELRKRIVANKNAWEACEKSHCTAQCDGYYTEQIIADGDKMLTHVGWDVSRMKNPDYCILQAHLTALCNYKCSYCCAEKWMKDLSRNDLPPEQMVDAAGFFTETFPSGLLVSMGGEPLVAKCFVPFMAKFLKGNWNIQLVTNMSRPEKLIELCALVPNEAHMMRIQVSLHLGEQKFNAKAILDALIQIRDRFGVQFAATVVGTNENKKLLADSGVRQMFEEAGAMWFNVLEYFPS